MARNIKILSCLLAVLAAFIVGVFWTKFQLFPYKQLYYAVREFKIASGLTTDFTPPPFDQKHDPKEMISIKNQAHAEENKARLTQFVLQGKTNETIETISKEKNCACNSRHILGAATTDRYTLKMNFGFESVIIIHRPRQSSKGLVILHGGHSMYPDELGGRLLIEKLLNSGFEVATFSMLFAGFNDRTLITKSPVIGNMVHIDHSRLGYLENSSFNPLTLFVEPVLRFIDDYQAENPNNLIAMTGLSGGGWTTILAAAIDERIICSYPVAGNGDFEQNHLGLLKLGSELNWYVLAASKPWRRQVQHFNKHDSCCFMGESSKIYESAVADAVKLIAGGHFETVIDNDSYLHHWSEATHFRSKTYSSQLGIFITAASFGGS